MFYLHLWGTSFSKQRSVNIGERDVGSVSPTHYSNVLFAEFEQVIACWGSITLDYLGFLLFLSDLGCVCVRFDFIKLFTFCIFTLSSVDTSEYIESQYTPTACFAPVWKQ